MVGAQTAKRLVFYFVQNEPGEDLLHPNLFELPSSASAAPTMADIQNAFPLAGTGSDFHWRFRTSGGANGGYFWVDGQDAASPVPIYGGHVFAKLLRLDNLPHAGMRAKDRQTRPGVSKANARLKTPAYARKNQAESNSNPRRSNTPPASWSQQSKPAVAARPGSAGSLPHRSVSQPIPVIISNTSAGGPRKAEWKGKSADEIANARIRERKAKELEQQNAAVQKLREREAQAVTDQADRSVVAKTLTPKLLEWSGPEGNRKGVRALLSTMHGVMWEGSGWKKTSVLVRPLDVKKSYFRAMLIVHPDKIPSTAKAEVKFVAQRCFECLNTEYTKFQEVELK